MVTKKISLRKNFFLIFFLYSIWLWPQAEMADMFRAEGKIYVVVGVMALVLLSVMFFLFLLDRKINNTIKNIKDREVKEK